MPEADSAPLAPPPLPANPFLLLESYDESRELYGRESDLTLMKARVFSGRTTLLFAGSGAGKTSFLQAKLIPDLREYYEIFFWRGWSQPGDPAVALAKLVSADRAASLEEALAPFRREPERARDWSEEESAPASRTCVLILDQFEEIFQYHAYEAYFPAFLDSLSQAVRDAEIQMRLVLSMREEFLGELSVFDNRVPDLFANYYRLKQPDCRQAADIIRRTCGQVGIEVDAVRLDQLVQDLATIEKERPKEDRRQVALRVQRDIVPPPYLQIACYRLWEDQKAGKAFPALYRAGAATLCLRRFCREKLDSLSYGEQNRAAAAFEYLVTKKGAKMAYELSRLAQHTGSRENALKATLAKLSETRTRILRHSPAPDGSDWFELYHDVFGSIVYDWSRDFQKKKRNTAAAVAGAAVVLILLAGIWRSIYTDPQPYLNALRSASVSYSQKLDAVRNLQRIGKSADASDLMAAYWRGRAEADALREDREAALLDRLYEAQASLSGAERQTALRLAGQIAASDFPNLIATARNADLSKVSLSSDGQILVTQTSDGKLRAWNATTGEPLTSSVAASLDSSDRSISPSPIAVGHDAKLGYIAASRTAKVANLVSLTTGRTVGEFNTPPGASFWLAPNLAYGIVSSPSGGTVAKDLATSERIPIPFPGVHHCIFNGDSSLWAMAAGGSLRFWNPSARRFIGPEIRSPAGPGDNFQSLTFSPDASRICTISVKGAAVWDVRTGKRIGAAPAYDSDSCAIRADNSLLILSYAKDGITVWDPDMRHSVSYSTGSWPALAGFVTFQLAPQGGAWLRYVGGAGGTAGRMWSTAAGRPITQRHIDVPNMDDLVAYRGRQVLVHTAAERAIRLVDLDSGKVVPAGLPSTAIDFFAEWTGNYLATTGQIDSSRMVSVWDMEHRQLLMKFPDIGLDDFRFTPDSSMLMFASHGSLSGFHIPSCQHFGIGKYQGRVLQLLPGPDSRYVAVIIDPAQPAPDPRETNVMIFELPAGKQVLSLEHVTGPVVLGREKLFATVAQTTQLLDLKGGSSVTLIPSPAPEVAAAAFGPGEAQVVVGLADGSLKLWNGGSWDDSNLSTGTPARQIVVNSDSRQLMVLSRFWAHLIAVDDGKLKPRGSRFLDTSGFIPVILPDGWPTLRVLYKGGGGLDVQDLHFDAQDGSVISDPTPDSWEKRMALKVDPDSGKFVSRYDEGLVIRNIPPLTEKTSVKTSVRNIP